MDFPKSPDLISRLVKIGTARDSIVLDFFAGSATTAQSVLSVNAEDGGMRQFIMVQLPEEVDPSSNAAKAGYTNARATLEDSTTGDDLAHRNLDGIRGGVGLEYNGGGAYTVRLEYRYSNYEDDFSRNQGVLSVGLRF